MQLEILSYLPLGFKTNLEMLAIQEGDYGAITDTWVEPCHNDPSMVKVGVMHRVDELEKMGWEGFPAEQL